MDLRDVIAGCLAGEGSLADRVRRLEKVLGLHLAEIAETARKEDTTFFMNKFLLLIKK